MKTNYALVLGGLIGLIVPLAAVSAYFLLGEAEASAIGSPASTEASAAECEIPEPIPAPASPELTATHSPIQAPTRALAAPTVERRALEIRETGSIRVRRLILTREIEGHEPVGDGERFVRAPGERLYAFVDAANDRDEPVALSVTFEPTEGETTGHVELEVPAGVARYRTWAFTRNAERAGRWDAVVRGPDGRELARRSFEIVD